MAGGPKIGPLNANTGPQGIFRTRDLVTLFYGVRMVASILEANPALNNTAPIQLIGQDPRRIRYEIILANNGDAVDTAFIGSQASFDPGTSQQYYLNAGDTLIIERNWITDLDAVTINLWGVTSNGNIGVTTRETFLTPAGNDESLLIPQP
jgi:hypothetical protein